MTTPTRKKQTLRQRAERSAAIEHLLPHPNDIVGKAYRRVHKKGFLAGYRAAQRDIKRREVR